MTNKAINMDKQEFNQELKSLIEDAELPKEEPDHPGWLSMARS